MLNHKHILVNATIKNPINDTAYIEKWFERLVEAVDMKILIPPKVVYCDTSGNEGVTGIVCIETSHSSIHIWSKAEVPFLNYFGESVKKILLIKFRIC